MYPPASADGAARTHVPFRGAGGRDGIVVSSGVTYAGRDGLDAFNASVRDTLVSQTITARDGVGFRATMVAAALGPLRLVTADIAPLSARRRAEGSEAAAGSVFLLLSDRGGGEIRHRHGREPIDPGHLVIVPGEEPFDVDYHQASRVVFVVLPEPVVRDRFPALRARIRACALGPTATGVGRRLGGLAQAAAATDDPADADDLATILDATLHVMLRRTVGDVVGDQHHRLRVAADRLIDRSLTDPDLGPTLLARRLGVSVRQLHRAFDGSGTTVAGHIRERRLDACARALVDPAQASRTVTELAMRYGFASSSHLATWFRRRYGATPRAWRDRHGSGQDPALA